MSMTMTPMPSIPPSQSRPTDVVSMTATDAGPVRRIHPLAIAAAIALAGLYALAGLLLTLSIYGLVLGVPLLAGAVTEMILLGRHRNPRATHPAWPVAVAAGLNLVVAVIIVAVDGWAPGGLVWFAVAGLHGLIAAGLWETTTLTSAPTHTTGQG